MVQVAGGAVRWSSALHLIRNAVLVISLSRTASQKPPIWFSLVVPSRRLQFERWSIPVGLVRIGLHGE